MKMKKTKEKKDNRYRLSKKETEILESLRDTGTIPDEHKIVSDINKTNFHSKHTELKTRYSQSLQELKETKAQLNTLIDLREAKIKPAIIKPSSGRQESKSTMILVASDWHLEESVDPSTVNNLNEFNLEIATERAENFFKKSLLMYKLLGKNFNIKTCVLALLGDFINGYIHDEFVEENELSPTQTILMAKKLLISGIDFLLENTDFEKIIVPCCYGNHGRTTQKSRIASAFKNSFEWLMYKDLEYHYSKNPKIQFMVSESYHCYLNLYDKYTLRFHHGDWLKYNGGVGGITVPAQKAISQWNKSIPVYKDFFGHYHTSLDCGNFICNGSLVGFNNFAISIKASFEAPKQSMVIINEQHGQILSAPIFVS